MSHPLRKIYAICNEKGEALPAAIIGAIVSSILLLGIGTAIALILTNQSHEQRDSATATEASSVEAELKSDLSSAATITPVSSTKTVLDVPDGDDNCRLVTWEIRDTTIYRTLSIYDAIKRVNGEVVCDTASTAIVSGKQRTVVKYVQAPSGGFTYFNKVGREIAPTSPPSFSDPAAVMPDNLATVESEWNSMETSFVELHFRVILNNELVSRDVNGHKNN